MNKILILLFALFTTAGWSASTPTDTFRLANDAMQNGEDQDAIHLYTTIADQGYGSYQLFYNLGTAYAKQDDWYHARLYLERASLLDPTNEDVTNNLEFVKTQLEDFYHYPRYPLFGVIAFVHAHLGYHFLNIMLLGLILVFSGSIYLFSKDRTRRNLIIMGAAGAALLVIATLVFFEQTYLNFHSVMGIVDSEGHALYQHPDEQAAVENQLPGGFKVRIRETVGPWVKVDLADGTEGWLKSDQITMLNQSFKMLKS